MFPFASLSRRWMAVVFGAVMVWSQEFDLAARPTERPNIVLVLADDLGWGDLGSYNRESKIQTPHLDRLAASGLRFTDAHSPSAVCTPTRYGLLAGRYAWRTRLKQGVLWGYSPPLIEAGRLTMPEYLRRAGYRTAGVGKWHLGLEFATREPVAFGDRTEPAADPATIDWERPLRAGPRTVGFDEFFGIPASLDMVPYVYIENDRIRDAPTVRLSGDRSQRQGGGGFWRGGPGAPGFTVEGCQPTLTGWAEAFLRRQKRGEPFFLYMPLTAPHDPWVPTAEFRGRSGCGPRGDFVMQVDDTLGRLMRVLEESGLAENTLVMFTSDNGAHWLPEEVERTGHAANGRWRGMKSDVHEGGHRVPLIAYWPGRTPTGRTTDALVGLQDIFATLADVVDERIPSDAGEDSVSFARVLRGKKGAKRPPLVMHSIRGTFAVRDGPWKWIDGADSGGWTAGRVDAATQLYHLGRDPGETENLADSQKERVVRFRRILDGIRKEAK